MKQKKLIRKFKNIIKKNNPKNYLVNKTSHKKEEEKIRKKTINKNNQKNHIKMN